MRSAGFAAVVASAGEVLQIQQGTSAGGVLTWSAPTRKRAPADRAGLPEGSARTRWQNGELSVSGIGCDIPGASGVTVSIVGLGGEAIPAEPASSAVLDETGGFEVVVPGVTAGDACRPGRAAASRANPPAGRFRVQAPPSRPVRRP